MHVVMVHLNYMTEIQNARRGRRQDVQFSGIFCLLLDSRESVDLRAISRNTRHFHVSTSADLCIEGRRRSVVINSGNSGGRPWYYYR